MRVRAWSALALLFALTTIPRAQNVSLPQERAGNVASMLGPGVVVEKVTQGSDALAAGIQEGDVLLGWSRGDLHGALATPFELAYLELEQGPRGAVLLSGMRGTEKKEWLLGLGTWGLQVRPNCLGALLTASQQCMELIRAGKAPEAAALWRTASQNLDADKKAWLMAWFAFRSAETLNDARQWKAADDAYQESIELADAFPPETKEQLLRAWADALRRRGAWNNAEKYLQQALVESRKLNDEGLVASKSLHNLGLVAWGRGDLPLADRYYQQALVIREKVAPGSIALAATLNNIGIVAKDRGELKKAEDVLGQALAIRQRLAPDSIDVAGSLNNLGNVFDLQSNFSKSEEYYLRALAIRQKLAPGGIDEATSWNNLGNISGERGDLEKAEQYFLHALAIKEKLEPDTPDFAMTLANLGVVQWEHRNTAQAEAYYRRALVIDEKFQPESLETARVMNNLAVIGSERGDLASAETYYLRALAIREKLSPQSKEVSGSLSSLAGLAEDRGDLAKSEQYFRRAVALGEKVAPGSSELADYLTGLGWVVFKQGHPEEAEGYLNRSLSIYRRLSLRTPGAAQILINLGMVAAQRGDLTAAEAYHREALELRAKLMPGSIPHAESLASLAEVMNRKQQPAEALQLFEQALNALESQAMRLGGREEVRAGFRAKHQDFYQEYADLLVARGDAAHAFDVLERSRARTLLETLASAHVDLHNGADLDLINKERSLEAEINAKQDRRIHVMAAQHAEEQVKALESEISKLTAEFQALEASIRFSTPGYAALTQPRPLTSKQVQEELLDEDTLLLEYSLGIDHSYVFAVTASSLEVHELPKREEIEKPARRLYELLTARNRDVRGESQPQRRQRMAGTEAAYTQAAADLSWMILRPVAAQLQRKRLLVVADGILQYVPFAALPEPGASQERPSIPVPLVVKHEIVNLPSASVLAVLRQQEGGRSHASKTLAVLADPVFDRSDPRVTQRGAAEPPRDTQTQRGSGNASTSTRSADLLALSADDIGLERDGGGFILPRLRFSRQEADAIMELIPRGSGMEAVDFNANRATGTSPDLAQYRIVHFATHGLVNARHPELSGLVLSLVDQDGTPQEGFLRLQDIYNLNLPADLVVLSACETGLGREINGEGLIGLTRGFMYAGASRVVASLWNVSDAATATLMASFYRAMETDGQPPAAALRTAQIRMWKQARWKSPYYWAAFQIQGEWK